MKNEKLEVITFKADKTLIEAMSNVENRSDFIRSAILAALENTCPLCHGAGFLSASQREHWENFMQHHSWNECDDCHEEYLVCALNEKK